MLFQYPRANRTWEAPPGGQPPGALSVRLRNFYCGCSFCTRAGVCSGGTIILFSGAVTFALLRGAGAFFDRAVAFCTSIIALYGGGAGSFFDRAAAFVRAGVSVFTRSVVFFNELYHSANKRYSAADSNRSLRRLQPRTCSLPEKHFLKRTASLSLRAAADSARCV